MQAIMKSCVSTILLSLLSLMVFGQDRQEKILVSAKVVALPGGEPVSWASMWSYEEGKRKLLKVSYAKFDGFIAWQAPRTGSYKLVFHADGYVTDSLTIALAADTTLGTIRLYPDLDNPSIHLEAAVITAERPLLTHVLDRWVYDVSRDPEAKRKKMSEIIDKIPRINSNTADGRLEYDGVKIQQVLIDGERNEMINAGTQFPMRLIRGDVMDKIEVIPPGSPQYDNDGYILNITTSRPLPNGYAAEIKGDAATSNAYGGSVDVVSKIRDKVVLRFGYSVNYGNSPRLNSYSLREQYNAVGATVSSLETASESWNERLWHNLALRGSTKLWGQNLYFGIRTSMGESNANTQVQTIRHEANGQETFVQTQTIKTKFIDHTTPRVSGDFQYFINQSKNRTTQFLYQYNDNRDQTSRLQTIFDGLQAVDSPEEQQSWQADRASQTHATQWIDKIKIKSPANDPYGFCGQWLSISAIYNHRRYNQSQYEGSMLTGGLDYRQQVVGLIPGYNYRSLKWQGTANFSLEFENDKGGFLSTGSPLDYSQFTFNPSFMFLGTFIPKHILLVNYIERSVRPSFARLDPYITDTDPNNLFAGNPELRPEHLRRISLSISRRIEESRKQANRAGKGLLSGTQNEVTLGFSYEIITHAIEQVTSLNTDGISMTTYENIGQRNKYGINIKSRLSLIKIINIQMTAGYSVESYHSPNPNVDGTRIGGANCEVYLSGRLWPTGSTTFSYWLSSNMGTSQAFRVYYNHNFRLAHTQALIKNILFASVEISNPFKSRISVHNQITGVNFRMDSSRDQLGRILKFSLRWNFGRLKDRVADAQKIDDDTLRD